MENDRSYTELANDILAQLHIDKRVERLSEINSDFFVTLYEGLLSEKLPDVIRNPQTKEDEIHNCQCVIDSLSLDVLHTTLSHIQGEDIVNGDRQAIGNLIEVFSGFMEYLLCRIESEVSDNDDESPVEEQSHEDIDRLHPDIIDDVLTRELGKGYQEGPVTSTQKDRTETTAELIALGDSVYRPSANHGEVPHPAHRGPHPLSQPVATSSFMNLKEGGGQMETTADLIRESQEAATKLHSNMRSSGTSVELPRAITRDNTAHIGDSMARIPASSTIQPDASMRSVGLPALSYMHTSVYQPEQTAPRAVRLPPATYSTNDPQRPVSLHGMQEPYLREPLSTSYMTRSHVIDGRQLDSADQRITTDRSAAISGRGVYVPTAAISDPVISTINQNKLALSRYDAIKSRSDTVLLAPQNYRTGLKETGGPQVKFSGRNTVFDGAQMKTVMADGNNEEKESEADVTSSSVISPPQPIRSHAPSEFDTLGTRAYREAVESENHVTSTTDLDVAKPHVRFEHHHYHHYSDSVKRSGRRETDPLASSLPVTLEPPSTKTRYASEPNGTGRPRVVQKEKLTLGGINVQERWPNLSAIEPQLAASSHNLDESFQRLQNRSRQLQNLSQSIRERSRHEKETTDYIQTKDPVKDSLRQYYEDRTNRRSTMSPVKTVRVEMEKGAHKENHDPVLDALQGPKTTDVLRGQTYRELQDIYEYKDKGQRDSDEDNVSLHSDSAINYDRPVRSETDVIEDLNGQYKKRVRFEDRTPGLVGTVHDKLKQESQTTKAKTQVIDKLYRQNLNAFKDEGRYKLRDVKKQASQKEKEYKKKVFNQPKSTQRKPAKPAVKYGSVVGCRGRSRVPSRISTGRGRKRSASSSPTIGRSRSPLVLGDDEILPLMLEDFPFVHLSTQAVQDMWRRQFRQVEQLSKTAHEVKQKKSKAQSQVEEADKKQKILLAIMKKEMEHNKRMKDIKERRSTQLSVKSKVQEQRLQTAKARRYYDEYQVHMRSKMLKKKTREEQIFKKLFKDGLEIQKQRIHDLRNYAREHRLKQAVKQQNELESLENYYRDQFTVLAESMSKERQDVQLRERAQEKVLNQMKRELKKKMEAEIRGIQSQIIQDEDDAYFRQLDADKLRHELQAAQYYTKF